MPPEEERVREATQTSSEEEKRTEEPPELIPLEGGGYKIPLGERYQVESTGTAPTDESNDEEK